MRPNYYYTDPEKYEVTDADECVIETFGDDERWVTIHLLSQSQPIVRNGPDNTYTKDGMYCVLVDGVVEKYPMSNIFRVTENL